MREFTNLGWPETPFGAEQRPFGHHIDMLTACTFEWTAIQDPAGLPVAVSLVYLRVRRKGNSYQVADDTLSIGFRTAVIGNTAEISELLMLADRALTGARRHAAIMAGHWLAVDLARIKELTAAPLRGVDGTLASWENRSDRQRGVAVMVDTGTEADPAGADLGVPLDPAAVPVPDCACCAAEVARRALARCLAVGLTAALHTSRYTWEGTFRVTDAIERAGWDILTPPAGVCCPTTVTPAGDASQTPGEIPRAAVQTAG